jgi:hypothetical protein
LFGKFFTVFDVVATTVLTVRAARLHQECLASLKQVIGQRRQCQ